MTNLERQLIKAELKSVQCKLRIATLQQELEGTASRRNELQADRERHTKRIQELEDYLYPPYTPAAAEVIDMRWRMPSTFPRNGEWVETKFVTLSRTGEDGQEEEMTLRMWRPICPDSGGCDLE